MTTDESFERVGHVTAGAAEQARKDHEENRQLWRDTQRQLNELSVRVNDLTLRIADTNDAIAHSAEESRAADQQLRERIDSLVSAIGEFIRTPR